MKECDEYGLRRLFVEFMVIKMCGEFELLIQNSVLICN